MDKCFTKILLGCLLCSLVAVMGCCINIGCPALAKYERQVRLSAPLAAGSVFAAKTHNGSITINGADVTDCSVIATIKARAITEGAARELAEQVKIKLEPAGNRLTAKIEKPTFMRNKSISVSLNVTVPDHTDLGLTTHNGGVKITNITGRLSATTHNGKVAAEHIAGAANFKTHNGSVICKDVSGDINLRTHNGSAKAFYSETAEPVCNVSIVTHNGGVNFTAPPNFSAAAELSTHNGSIKTELPITVTGKVGKRKLTGTIGAGEGKLHLETHNGSIKIR